MSSSSPSKLWLQIGNRFNYFFQKGLKDGLRARTPIIDELACCDTDRIYTQAIGGVALHKKGENEMDIVKKTCENCGWADISACEKCNPSTHSMWMGAIERRSIIRYGDMYTKPGQSRIPNIKKVIFNNPATIVFWADGTKTVVKCQEGDYYDEEAGLAMAIAKKALGNNGSYYKVFDKWLPYEWDPEWGKVAK